MFEPITRNLSNFVNEMVHHRLPNEVTDEPIVDLESFEHLAKAELPIELQMKEYQLGNRTFSESTASDISYRRRNRNLIKIYTFSENIINKCKVQYIYKKQKLQSQLQMKELLL